MGEPRINLTRHAAAMLAERGIGRKWVDRTINEPDSVEPDSERANVYHAFRAIPEREGRVPRVVYSLSENEIRIFTAFFDRARRR
jgi:uncharacterized protein DUF4258